MSQLFECFTKFLDAAQVQYHKVGEDESGNDEYDMWLKGQEPPEDDPEWIFTVLESGHYKSIRVDNIEESWSVHFSLNPFSYPQTSIDKTPLKEFLDWIGGGIYGYDHADKGRGVFFIQENFFVPDRNNQVQLMNWFQYVEKEDRIEYCPHLRFFDGKQDVEFLLRWGDVQQ